MTKKIILLLVSVVFLLSGCVTKQSLVASNQDFKPLSTKESSRVNYRIGLAMNDSMDSDVARFVAQKEGLTYDFEFKVGQDIRKTLPNFLDSFFEVIPLNSIGDGKGLDFVLVPKVTSSLFTYIGMSAAPRYELTIALEVSILKQGIVKEKIYIRKESRVEVSAFQNSDQERTELMRNKYEEQIVDIYKELEGQLKEFVKSK